MNLTSMKMSDAEAKEYASCAPTPGNAPAYPYGLCIELNNDTLAKLGITELPAAGATMMLMAQVSVSSLSVRQQKDGEAEAGLSLQITDMALTAPSSNLEQKLWPSK